MNFFYYGRHFTIWSTYFDIAVMGYIGWNATFLPELISAWAKWPPFRRWFFQMHIRFVFWLKFHWSLFLRAQLTTRTTRTPAFWGYPPPPHDYPPTLLSHVGSQVKTWSNDLEDIGQGQRSSHATHLLMLVIICTKYGKNPSGTVDATERTRFSRLRPNDLEDIDQGQRSLCATHLLIQVTICATYGKNSLRTVDFFFKVKAEKYKEFAKNSNFCAKHKL